MTGFDYAVITAILLSALLGWWRGLVYEILSLLGWVAAWMVARLFSAAATPYMPEALGDESVRVVAAFVALFVATLIVSGILAWLLSKLIKWVGLGWLDGLLGVVFGVLRGTLVVLAVVILAGLTALPKEPFWRNAWSSKPLESMALTAQVLLPDTVAKKVSFHGAAGNK